LGCDETVAMFKRAERGLSGLFRLRLSARCQRKEPSLVLQPIQKIKGGAAPLVAPRFLVTLRSSSTVQHTPAYGKSATTSRLPNKEKKKKEKKKKKKQRQEREKGPVDYVARHHSPRDNGSTTADSRHCPGTRGDIPCPFDTEVLRLASA